MLALRPEEDARYQELQAAVYRDGAGRAIDPDRKRMFRRKRITPRQIREVQRRLKKGESVEGVTRDMHIGRWIVQEIRDGRRTVEGLLPMDLEIGEKWLPEAVRCGGCGGLIHVVPCRTCRTRETVAK